MVSYHPNTTDRLSLSILGKKPSIKFCTNHIYFYHLCFTFELLTCSHLFIKGLDTNSLLSLPPHVMNSCWAASVSMWGRPVPWPHGSKKNLQHQQSSLVTTSVTHSIILKPWYYLEQLYVWTHILMYHSGPYPFSSPDFSLPYFSSLTSHTETTKPFYPQSISPVWLHFFSYPTFTPLHVTTVSLHSIPSPFSFYHIFPTAVNFIIFFAAPTFGMLNATAINHILEWIRITSDLWSTAFLRPSVSVINLVPYFQPASLPISLKCCSTNFKYFIPLVQITLPPISPRIPRLSDIELP